jgi:hypothetical protein
MAGVWVVLHLLLVAGAPVLDAAVGHADQVVAHWEDADGGDCPASHGADQCQLCQSVVKARALSGGDAAPAIPESSEQLRAERARAATPTFAFLDGHSSRAPPLG